MSTPSHAFLQQDQEVSPSAAVILSSSSEQRERSVLAKRKAMIMLIQGMIQLKFPNIGRRRCVRISKSLEYRLWAMAQEEHKDEGGDEAAIAAYSDTKTVQVRLRDIVRNLQAAAAASA